MIEGAKWRHEMYFYLTLSEIEQHTHIIRRFYLLHIQDKFIYRFKPSSWLELVFPKFEDQTSYNKLAEIFQLT